MFRRALLAALPALALFSVPVSAKQLNECLPIDRALSSAPTVAAAIGSDVSVDRGAAAAELVAAIMATVPEKAHEAEIILAYHKDGEAVVYFGGEGGFCHVEHFTADETRRIILYVLGRSA